MDNFCQRKNEQTPCLLPSRQYKIYRFLWVNDIFDPYLSGDSQLSTRTKINFLLDLHLSQSTQLNPYH